jgi:flagellar motor switch protein FliM
VANLEDRGVLAKKVALAASHVMQGGFGADRSWRVSLARAARDMLTLGLTVVRLNQSRGSLAEVLDLPPDRAMIAVLEGPGEGLGLMAISAPVLAAMTEIQTIGRVSAVPQAVRKPTRTDAAMVAGFVDAALEGLELALAEEADLQWAGGFRYASFLDDPRPLGLLMEDIDYRILTAEVSVEDGARTGQILMVLPAAGRGKRPKTLASAVPAAVAGHAFAEDLAEQVDGAACVLTAVIHHLICPLSDVIALQVGDLLPLSFASLDQVGFEGIDGQRIAEGRLGQNRGMRAVRLTPPAQPKEPTAEARYDIVDAQALAATG